VFLNLLTNAREATPHGGRIVVTVSAGDRVVEISIADTGCGIPPRISPGCSNRSSPPSRRDPDDGERR
jgi:signal transduction histidine kinase